MKKYYVIVLLMFHLISSLVYLYFDDTVKYSQDIMFYTLAPVTYENFFGAYYFGTEALIFILFLLVAKREGKLFIEHQLLNVEAGFIGILGMIYVLDELQIYTANARERALYLTAYSLFVTIIVGRNAIKYGYFKDE